MSMTASGGGSGGFLSLAEWGTPGGTKVHCTPPKLVHIKPYICPDLPGRTCLAYDSEYTEMVDGQPIVHKSKRVFFDGSKFDAFEVRGFQVYDGNGAPTYNT